MGGTPNFRTEHIWLERPYRGFMVSYRCSFVGIPFSRQYLPTCNVTTHKLSEISSPFYPMNHKHKDNGLSRRDTNTPKKIIKIKTLNRLKSSKLREVDLLFLHAQSADEKIRTENVQHKETEVLPTVFSDLVGKDKPTEDIVKDVDIYTNVNPYTDQSLNVVLSRPYPVATGTWQTSDAITSLIATYHFPNLLLNIPFLSEKLNHFQYLRANIRFGIRLNTTPFHSGKLLVSYIPEGLENDVVYNKALWYLTDTSRYSIYQAACNQHRIVSANTQVTTEFIIPYVHPRLLYDLRSTGNQQVTGKMGTVQVHVLHPLRSANTASAFSIDYTVYANFDNPEVSGLAFRAQMSTKEEAQVRSEKGVISGIASASRKLIHSVRRLPLIGDQVSRAEPVFKAIESISRAMDLAMPTTLASTDKRKLETVTNLANTSGLDGSNLLSLDPENRIASDFKIFGDDIDYDVFDNYKMLPGLIMLGSFNNESAVNSEIFDRPLVVCPTFVHTATQPGHYRRFDMTPIANLAQHFRFWTGGLKYHIMFTASSQTSYRVRLSWNPDGTYAGTPGNADAGNLVSAIIDGQGDTSYSFTVPYLQAFDWLEVPDLEKTNLVPRTNGDAGMNGQLSLRIVNPPVTSNMTPTSSTVYYAVWISGAEDFRVNRPAWGSRDYSAIRPPAPAPEEDRGSEDGLRAQSKHEESHIDEVSDMRLLFRKQFSGINPFSPIIRDRVVHGENIGRWSVLLHRFVANTHLLQVTSTGTPVYPWTPGGSIAVDDFFFAVRYSFLYARGSLRFKLEPLEIEETSNFKPGEMYYVMNAMPGTANHPPETWFTQRNEGTSGGIFNLSQVNPIIEFQIPFYERYIMDSLSGYQDPDTSSNKDYLPGFFVRVESTQTKTCRLWRAVGDDFSLGWPVYPRPLFIDLRT